MNTLKKDAIIIRFERSDTVTDCSSAIIIPERAIIKPAYIRTMTTNSTAHSKHEFHAMAQIVFFNFRTANWTLKPYTVLSQLNVKMKLKQ